jgi:acyl carrier protein
MSDRERLRQLVVDWLDDNYHFGDAAAKITSDDLSFLDHSILNSLGFVALILYLEDTFGFAIDRKRITRDNFDSLRKIVDYVLSHKDYKGF